MKKPLPEAKALSLYLMAYKKKDPVYKEKSKRINRLWDLVEADELSNEEYVEEVQKMLTSYGGYEEVIKKTVRFYIDTTGEWNLKGDDKYSKDAKRIANEILKQKQG